jgi:ankyrin repeat protein
MSLMHKAAYENNSYLLTYLRDAAGFDIEEPDSQGNTPLHFACSQRADYTAFWLISFAANVNA